MTKYVIGPEVALRLAQEDAETADEHKLLAPTLLRSQLLSMLYRAVRQEKMTKSAISVVSAEARAASG
jgi:hypothetical protein